ncbi:MAG: FitA-like ribbon-helix-helix domain-containing protein [Caulobacterales bacterium]|jgi:plasmid stability protein
MTELLIRGISDAVISPLKRSAELAGISVEEEVRRMLEASVASEGQAVSARLECVRRSIGVLEGISTTALLREDRDAH